MADGIEIKVSGLSAVSRKLKRFDKEYKTRVVLASLYAGARVVQKEAKKNVPVKTGRLRRAIILRTSKIKRWKHGEYGVFMTLRTGKGKMTRKMVSMAAGLKMVMKPMDLERCGGQRS